MAEQTNIPLQGLKTIREMQESLEQDNIESAQNLQNEQKTLQSQVAETQKILDGKADLEITPDLTKAKTIKESMAEWNDDHKIQGTNPMQKQQENIQDTQPTIQTAPLVQKSLETQEGSLMQEKNIEKNIKENVEKTTQENKATQSQGNESPRAELKQEKYQQIVQANANTRQETWILLEEFLKLSGLEKAKVIELIKDKTIRSKKENNKIYVEASTGTSALIKKVENRLVSLDMSGNALDPVFVEKTIATILGLHDKVISSKDETIAAFKSENSFLKEALVSMQEIYDDDKKTIEILQQQLQKTQEEVEFVKRKYKLMWGKVSNSAT